MKQLILFAIGWVAVLALMIVPVLIAASRDAISPKGSRAGTDRAASPPDKQS